MNIEALFAGKPRPFGPRQSPSSIIKQAHQTLHIERDGAIEDEQGNKKLHGGPEMALHQYSQASYDILKLNFPSVADALSFGSIGENISCPNMTDENVLIGDIYRIGSVLLQVNSPRMPCTKINQRYACKGIDLFIGKQGITGWYYRVLETGQISVGDSIDLIERDQHSMSIKQIMYLVKSSDKSNPIRQDAANIPSLAQEWVAKLMK